MTTSQGDAGHAGAASPCRHLYLEPFGGLAGDMLLAALLDLNDDRFRLEHLQRLAEALVPGEAKLSAETAWRGSLSGTHLSVQTPETQAPPHRHLKDLVRVVEGAPLSERAKAFTVAVLRRIAVAEGRVHGCSPDEIHFHEVGAVDTLIDVGGIGLALDALGIEGAFASPPILGSGVVRCAHGEMPVPAPATAEILRGAEVIAGGGGGERCTPTGAAVLMELVELMGDGEDAAARVGRAPAQWRCAAIGYGAGTRDPREGPPNLLRVQLGESLAQDSGSAATEAIDEVRVNLDDMSPEAMGVLVGHLRTAGALDVYTAPVFMKKDRPGTLVTALVRPVDRESILQIMIRHSSTFGVRWTRCDRMALGRRFETVEVDHFPVRIKVRLEPDGAESFWPEHDDVAALAVQLGVSLEEARRRVLAAAAGGGERGPASSAE